METGRNFQEVGLGNFAYQSARERVSAIPCPVSRGYTRTNNSQFGDNGPPENADWRMNLTPLSQRYNVGVVVILIALARVTFLYTNPAPVSPVLSFLLPAPKNLLQLRGIRRSKPPGSLSICDWLRIEKGSV